MVKEFFMHTNRPTDFLSEEDLLKLYEELPKSGPISIHTSEFVEPGKVYMIPRNFSVRVLPGESKEDAFRRECREQGCMVFVGVKP